MEHNTNKPKPYKLGQQLIVKPQTTGQRGDGVYKDQESFIIIVRRSEQGKTYRIEITGVYSTYAFARILEEIKTAEEINKNIDKEEDE